MNFFGKKYRLSETAVFSNLGEEAVILDPKKGSYYGLNDVGVVVWDQIATSPKSLAELCESVMEIYSVDKQECENDVEELIGQLVKAGLVIEE